MMTTVFTAYLNEGNARMMHFLLCLVASAIWNFRLDFSETLHDWMILHFGWWPVHVFEVWFPLEVFKMILTCWKIWVNSCMNACCFSSRKPAVVQSFLRNNKLHNNRTFLVGCEKSRFHVVEFSVFSGFALCFVADANYADRTLCKYLWWLGCWIFTW